MARPLLLLFLLAPVLILSARPQAAEQPVPTPSTLPTHFEVVGVASCAAMACHNGGKPAGNAGSEYSAWISQDPHARAYRTLFREDSRQMHERLARTDPSLQSCQGPQDNPLCLRCHGMGDSVSARLQADGVGCERCHGAAGGWKNTHYQKGFDRHTPGFVDLRDLRTRTHVCTGCHVGRAGMEVDHDLLAAGHPRLRFEHAAYYSGYPRHWCDRDRERLGADVEARSWVLGQLASAQAALELLASRATPQRLAWPEFAELDCAACHHGLTASSSRQQRDRSRAEAGDKVRPGEVPWGSWYHAMMPSLATMLEKDASGRAGLLEELSALEVEMRRPVPSTRRVHDRATRAARLVADWSNDLAGRQYTATDLRAWMTHLASREELARRGWDSGTQLYLGLAALHQTRGEVEPGFRDCSTLRKPLLNLRSVLAQALPTGPNARPKYDSPRHYRSDSMLRGLEVFRQRLAVESMER